MENDPHKRREAELLEQQQQDAAVFSLANLAMKNRLKCDASLEMCSKCGEENCLNIWRKQNKLWGLTDKEAQEKVKAVLAVDTARKTGGADSCMPNVKNTKSLEPKKSDHLGHHAFGLTLFDIINQPPESEE